MVSFIIKHLRNSTLKKIFYRTGKKDITECKRVNYNGLRQNVWKVVYFVRLMVVFFADLKNFYLQKVKS